jgi:hypothetical protein
MSVDIRRMSKDDLDALNEQARIWKAQKNKPVVSDETPLEPVEETTKNKNVLAPPEQLPLL